MRSDMMQSKSLLKSSLPPPSTRYTPQEAFTAGSVGKNGALFGIRSGISVTAPQEKGKTMANNCATCFYHGKCGGMICCNFFLMTGQRRPCPAGEGCTVKVGKVPNWKSDWKRKKVNNHG